MILCVRVGEVNYGIFGVFFFLSVQACAVLEVFECAWVCLQNDMQVCNLQM